MSKLLESEFLTVDLQSIFNKQQAINTAHDDTAKNNGSAGKTGAKIPDTKNTGARIADWGKELAQRLAKNQELDPESRETEFDIESKFWDDFFADGTWDTEVAKELKAIDQLKKDIKKLGFKKQTNPILAFFRIKWVQTELVKTKLINSNTYKAIHNTIANRYVADSEFVKANNYNILYCRDLYLKPVTDMVTYLKNQKKSLPTKINFYDKNMQSRNISIFLVQGQTSTRQKSAKLRSLKDVNELLQKNGFETNDDMAASKKTGTLSRQDLIKIVNSLSAVQSQAALQFISMTTNNDTAKKALQKSLTFQKPSAEELMAATIYVSKYLKNINLSADDVEGTVELLLTRIKGKAQN